MTEAERIRSIEPRWLALLYIVLCLGAHFGDHDLRQEAELLKVSLCCVISSEGSRASNACRYATSLMNRPWKPSRPLYV